jgi:hypothetical protein
VDDSHGPPLTRRAVFFDVENSSRVEHISRLLEHLELGTRGPQTRVMAVGNWGVIGQETARLLSAHGAELLHSAPAFGVKDWSDLRIAVAAGVWLAEARPGDVLEIITDDQAFDAVGDVAAGLGVAFRRLSYRALVAAARVPAVESRRPTGSRRGRRGRGRRTGEARARGTVSSPGDTAASGEVQSAPREDLLGVVRELIAASGDASVTLDVLSNALKARGFRRPPGSPRLITRLRQMKSIEVSRTGTISLSDE